MDLMGVMKKRKEGWRLRWTDSYLYCLQVDPGRVEIMMGNDDQDTIGIRASNQQPVKVS